MYFFVLIPGGGHGAWCFDRLVPRLHDLGHQAVAVETPGADPHAGLDDHAAAVATAVAATAGGTAGDVVVVGHSLAGAFLPLAAARAGAARMVFLCGMLPVEGQSCVEQSLATPAMLTTPFSRLGRDKQGRTVFPPDIARQYFYEDCLPDVADWAVARLQPQGNRCATERFPVGGWPAVPAASIIGRDDRCLSPTWSRRASIERLGVPAFELPGGHSPHLARPDELAAALVDVAGR